LSKLVFRVLNVRDELDGKMGGMRLSKVIGNARGDWDGLLLSKLVPGFRDELDGKMGGMRLSKVIGNARGERDGLLLSKLVPGFLTLTFTSMSTEVPAARRVKAKT